MTAASAVPSKYDVVLDGQGYRFADAEQRRALYTFSPTFVQRTNVEGDYGDSQQDFWLTWSQRDWSLGEQQKFYRQDAGRDRREWLTANVDIRTQGQVTMRPAVKTITFPANPVFTSCAPEQFDITAASFDKLYWVNSLGAITDRGAHGLGAPPRSPFGIATDSYNVFVSTTAAGTVGVRKYDGATYTTFSASPSDCLAFLNNTLYGVRNDTSKLVRYDTAGVQTDVFQWKKADGTALGGTVSKILAWGGKLLILFIDGARGGELWQYDGTAPSILATFPRNFITFDMEVVSGVVFVSGSFFKNTSGSTANFYVRPAIYFYADGRLGVLWKANDYSTASVNTFGSGLHPTLAAFDEGLLFADQIRGALMYYDVSAGGVHSIGSYAVNASFRPAVLTAQYTDILLTGNMTTAYVFPDTTTKVSSSSITSSLIDFDSSLSKRFKSVKIIADIPAGATVDISYRLEDVDGAYTTIQSGAASGTEYPISANGRAISIKVTLNKGTSADGPTLRRVYLRAAPILDTFKRREYVFDLSGRNGQSHIELRDGTLEPRDGMQMAADLNAAAASTSPVTVTDRFATYSGIIEPDGFSLIEIRPEEFVATVKVREV